jgi:class 3 adenylate cyclase
MTVGSQVVDISVDPLDERRRRRRAFLRIGIPIAGVVLMIATILTIALYSNRANRNGVLALSNGMIDTLEGRIALEVSAYLDPAARAVKVARDTIRGGAIGDQMPSLEILAASLLRETPQLASFSFADADGNYALVRRGEAGGVDEKVVHNAPGPRVVTWIHRNAAGEETGREEDPKDDFDPRTRPWYVGAQTSDGQSWTGVYVFYSDRQPGLTVSVRHVGADGRHYVFGVDITLLALSNFLSSLEIGRSGRAVIMENTGQLIAAPAGSAIMHETNGVLTTMRVDELGDAVLTHAYDRFRVEGHGRRIVEVDGQRYIIAVTPLQIANRDWSMLIVVPEDDFVGFVTNNLHRGLAMSVIIIAVAVMLALLLVRQGFRADRAGRLLLDRQRVIGRQSAAFATVAAEAARFDPALNGPPRALTETLTDVEGARRAGIWRLAESGRILRCEDLFDRETRGHVDGLELHRDEFPQFFASLSKGEEIDVPDAARDRRTAELHRVLMNPVGTRAFALVPVRQGERPVGAIWLEDATSAAGGRDFVRAVANMIAPRMAQGAAAAASPERTSTAAAAVMDNGVRSFTADLRTREIESANIAAEVYSGVAVMVLQFTDPLTMAARLSGRANSLSDDVVCALQEIAADYDIPYLKIVGNDVVAAAGFAAENPAAATIIADTAVAVRDRCAALLEEDGRAQDFRIGIDWGMAIGSTVGKGPRVFNLWGDAVRTAESMAASALPGTVQATEGAYGRLRHDFLFRPRGSFYLQYVGEARTFVLAGRL